MQQRLLSGTARGCERVPPEPQTGTGRKASGEEMELHYAGIHCRPATGQDRFDKLVVFPLAKGFLHFNLLPRRGWSPMLAVAQPTHLHQIWTQLHLVEDGG